MGENRGRVFLEKKEKAKLALILTGWEFFEKSSPIFFVPLAIVDMCLVVVFPDFELGGVGRGGEAGSIVGSLSQRTGGGKTLETYVSPSFILFFTIVL